MSVVHVAYALAPVASDTAGGAEQVLATLDRSLVALGHRSAVVALAGSEVAGRLFATPPPAGALDAWAKDAAARALAAEAARAVRALRPDVIHAHGLDFHATLPHGGAPALVTLHLPPSWYPPEALAPSDGVTLVCVSRAQARETPESARVRAIVPNGVPLDRFRPAAAKEPFALVLGRICPEKAIHVAIDAARRAGLPLRVAGRAFPYPEHLRYLEEEVRPRLDGERVFVGAVGGEEKARLLATAACLVVPSVAPETSSLVAMEALASGTPVVARAVGALPEVIEDGVTGFLVRSDADLAPAMRAAAGLDPAACRRAAEQRFDARRMVGRYLALYRELARERRVMSSARAPRPDDPPSPPAVAGERERSASATSSSPTPEAVHPERSAVASAAARSRGTVLLLDGVAALTALAPEWRDLADRDPASTPFQRPEWLLPYCRARGVEAPWAVALRVGARLAALAPLVVYEDGGQRIATLLGGGLSDWQDALVDPALAPDGGARLLAAIAEERRRYDTLLLEQLPASSPLGGLAPPAGLALADERDGVPCPAVALPSDAAALEGIVAPYLLENARYGRRRLSRMGEVRLTRARPEDLGAHLDALVALHTARWAARREAGVLAERDVLALHREAAPGLLARGLLRLHVLWVGDRAAGALLGFADRAWAAAYLSGFDPAFRAGSPGAVLFLHAMEEAVAEGARTFDFLRGREPYKYDWGAADRPARTRVFRVAAARRPDHDSAPHERRNPACASPPPQS